MSVCATCGVDIEDAEFTDGKSYEVEGKTLCSWCKEKYEDEPDYIRKYFGYAGSYMRHKRKEAVCPT